MVKKAFPAILVLTLALTAPLAFGAAGDKWLHVRVEEGGEDGERVRINIPLSLVMSILPHIEIDEFSGGKIELNEFIDGDPGEIDIKGILEELKNAPDAVFVAVDGPDETVRIRKEKNFFLIHIEDRNGDETVQVRIPLAVADAIFSAETDELDLVAAVEALAEHGDGDLVSVQSDDETVRIWIDNNGDPK